MAHKTTSLFPAAMVQRDRSNRARVRLIKAKRNSSEQTWNDYAWRSNACARLSTVQNKNARLWRRRRQVLRWVKLELRTVRSKESSKEQRLPFVLSNPARLLLIKKRPLPRRRKAEIFRELAIFCELTE